MFVRCATMVAAAMIALSIAPGVAADCAIYGDDCFACTAALGWDGQCRYCPKSNDCHDPLSMYDHCTKDELVTVFADCPAKPTPPDPTPLGPRPNTTTLNASALLEKVFEKVGLPHTGAGCVNDIGSSTRHLRDAAYAATKLGNGTTATRELAAALSAFSSSANDCAVPEAQAKFDALAAKLNFAHVEEEDGAFRAYIGATEISGEIEAVINAVEAGDAAATASALAALTSRWSMVTGGCEVGGTLSASCQVVDGVLRLLGIGAADISDACKSGLNDATKSLLAGALALQHNNVTGAVELMAAGLNGLAQALGQDVCNVAGLAAVVKQLAPKMEAAVVKETGGAVQVLVGSADVYAEMYQAAQALARKDMVTFGEQIGALLMRLRAAQCATKACLVLEGLMQAAQIEASDYSACVGAVDDAWEHFERGVAELRDDNHDWTDGVADLGLGLKGIAQAVNACGIPELAAVLESVATKLGSDAASQEIGRAVQVLVGGVDVVGELSQAQADWSAASYAAFGADLGQIAVKVQDSACAGWLCHLVEGLLTQAGLFFSDLVECQSDLTQAEAAFISGAKAWSDGDFLDALSQWSDGLNLVAKGVTDCGVQAELQALEHTANVLSIANTTGLSGAAAVILHGADFFENLHAVLMDMEGHDYRGAGQELGHVLNTLSEWTTGHSCTSSLCYVVEGFMEFMGDFEGSIKSCEGDLTHMFGNFSAAYHDLTDQFAIDWTFDPNKDKVKKAVGEIGMGFSTMADAVGQCHVAELAEVLAKVAAKLSLSPQVVIAEEGLQILIQGVAIEQEVAEACQDYAKEDWVGFGYNLAKLLRVLL